MAETMVADKRANGAGVRRSRSGSDTRQRTAQINLKLLPTERKRIEEAARRVGITGPGHAQRYVRFMLGLDEAPAVAVGQ